MTGPFSRLTVRSIFNIFDPFLFFLLLVLKCILLLDPSPLKALADSVRLNHAQRNQPSLYQKSELSPLQKLVKDARRIIVDPILAEFALASDVGEGDGEADSPDELDPEEVKRQKERQKIRELKERKIRSCGLTIPLRAKGSNGVFIRRDIEDESAEVDIAFDDSEQATGTHISPTTPAKHLPPSSLPMAVTKSVRARRPSTRVLEHDSSTDPPRRRSPQIAKNKVTAKQEPEPESPPDPSKSSLGKRARTQDKPKPETYKLAWSLSEQNLLERLLDEIPDGEKNRSVFFCFTAVGMFLNNLTIFIVGRRYLERWMEGGRLDKLPVEFKSILKS